MIPTNFRCNTKSYSPAPNSVGDSAKFSSKVGQNFSKEKFHIPTFRDERVYLVILIWPITTKYIDVFSIEIQPV